MQQRLPSLRETPIAFAHRGARAHAAENTLESFALALRLGANGLETDAWMTRDGVVVLDHDGLVRRRGRKVPIADLDRSDLPGHIPALGDLLDECGVDYHLSIDVKEPLALAAVLTVTSAHGFDPSTLWLCHDDFAVVKSWTMTRPRARLVDSSRLHRLREGPERRISTLAELGVDALNMHQSDWTGGLAALAHRFGVLAFGWDAQHDHRLGEMFRMGLDAVYSDHVDRLVTAYRDEIGGVPPLPRAR